jgi:hypothetical protein
LLKVTDPDGGIGQNDHFLKAAPGNVPKRFFRAA